MTIKDIKNKIKLRLNDIKYLREKSFDESFYNGEQDGLDWVLDMIDNLYEGEINND